MCRSRRTSYQTNAELVKQVPRVQLHVVKVRWLCNIVMSGFRSLCFKSSLTSSRWQPTNPHGQLQSMKSVRTRNHWGCWYLQTPVGICTSIEPRGRTIWESGSSTHRRGRGSSGQWELWHRKKRVMTTCIQSILPQLLIIMFWFNHTVGTVKWELHCFCVMARVRKVMKAVTAKIEKLTPTQMKNRSPLSQVRQ